MYSSRHVAVQDIINKAKLEEEVSKRELLETGPELDVPDMGGDLDQDILVP